MRRKRFYLKAKRLLSFSRGFSAAEMRRGRWQRTRVPAVAFDLDPAVMQFDEAVDQSQPRALRRHACPAALRREALEHIGVHVRRQAGAVVGHRDLNILADDAARQPRSRRPGREFEGVGEKIEHDLAHAAVGSARNKPASGVQSTSKLRPTLAAQSRGTGGDFGEQPVEIDPFQLQPQRAGFHQRQIENVVDQLFSVLEPETMASTYSSWRVLSPPGTPRGQMLGKAQMVLSGVRSSYETCLMKSDLSRSAASSASLRSRSARSRCGSGR